MATSLQNFALNKYKVGEDIKAGDFASHAKLLMSDLTNILIKMGNLGLIDYNLKTQTIKILPRLDSYLNSRTKEGDYDDFFIRSVSKKSSNGILNLFNLSLEIEGAKSFILSKKKFVKVYPKLGNLVLGKNRSFIFTGVINAGRTEYFGETIKFDYEKFLFEFNQLDSMRLRVNSMHDSIKSPQVRVLSKLHNIDGEIFIDNPGNKSGKRKEFSDFPKLLVTNSPKVYYNNSERIG